MDVNNKLKSYAAMVEEGLKRFFPEHNGPSDRVFNAARYSLLGGGKRLRPALLLEFYTQCGGQAQEALPFACAVEMIHTYSLIHDDLPCMDDDDMRRGKPSCHKAFDEATAVLAGDALLNRAFEVMLAQQPLLDTEFQLKAASYIALRSGVYGMIGGQAMDMRLTDSNASVDELQTMVEKKTGALIKASCVGGCLLAGAPGRLILAAEEYAASVGLAFQIRDDLLDEEGDSATLGKPLHSDRVQGKRTFLSLLGKHNCLELIEEQTARALAAAQEFPQGEFLQNMAILLAGRTV